MSLKKHLIFCAFPLLQFVLLAPLISHVEVMIEPTDVNKLEAQKNLANKKRVGLEGLKRVSLEEIMSVRLKCFASEGQAIRMSSLTLMAAEPSGEWSSFEKHTTHKEIIDDGKQMLFTLSLLSGMEYKFCLDHTGCTDVDCVCERKNFMVLHFR